MALESTTVWAGVTTKKLILDIFLNSSKLSAKSVQVISPYTSNALDSHTVLHTLCTNYYYYYNKTKHNYINIILK
jgi:hypothetical protein